MGLGSVTRRFQAPQVGKNMFFCENGAFSGSLAFTSFSEPKVNKRWLKFRNRVDLPCLIGDKFSSTKQATKCYKANV